MKRFLPFLLIAFHVISLNAQEVKTDTVSLAPSLPLDTSNGLQLSNVRNYDGYLLDISSLSPVKTPLSSFSPTYEPLPDFSKLFKLNSNATYGTANSSIFGITPYSLGSMGFPYAGGNALSAGTGTIQMGSFRLKNGLILNTYGDYNAAGYRVNNPVEPWRRNNFQGSLELKSKNGKFGFRVDVQQYP